MEEKQGVVIIATHVGEDPERAPFPFVMGSAPSQCTRMQQ